MKCPKCGFENKQDALFCSQCGHKIPKRKLLSKKRIIIFSGLVILIACLVAGYFIFYNKDTKDDYLDTIDQGDKYYEDFDYQKAEDSYLQAIEIDPHQVEPYEKLADLYMAQNDYSKTAEILNKATASNDDQTLKTKYTLLSYLQDVLIKESSVIEEGNYQTDYTHILPDNRYLINSLHELSGVLSSRIIDFDNDNQDELLVLTLDNTIPSLDSITNQIIVSIYEQDGTEVTLSDQITLEKDILGVADQEYSGIFIQKHDDKIYLCGTLYDFAYNYSDGYEHLTFILEYQDNKFVKKLYKHESASTPSEEGYLETSKIVKEIGLTSDAKIIEKTGYEYFNFTDNVDDVLLKLTGQTNLNSNISQNLNDLVYKIELVLSNKKSVNTDVFDPVLKNYYESYQNGFTSNPNPDITLQSSGLQAQYNDDLKLYYCFQDINNDGIKELFIGAGDSQDDVEICDLWSYNGLNINSAPESFLYGYREKMNYYQNNIVEIASNYGEHQTNTNYQLNFLGKLVACQTNGNKDATLKWKELTEDLVNSSSSNNNAVDKTALKQELDALEVTLNEADQQAGSMIEIKQACSNALKQWQAKMNEIIDLLKKQMSKSEQTAFDQEQSQWEDKIEQEAKEASKENSGGSLEQLDYLSSKREATKERAYELLERL